MEPVGRGSYRLHARVGRSTLPVGNCAKSVGVDNCLHGGEDQTRPSRPGNSNITRQATSRLAQANAHHEVNHRLVESSGVVWVEKLAVLLGTSQYPSVVHLPPHLFKLVFSWLPHSLTVLHTYPSIIIVHEELRQSLFKLTMAKTRN